MNINKSFQILEALHSLQRENLTKKEFNAKYPHIEYEKILSLKEKIEKDKILKEKIIKFHNEDILVDFIEKVNIEKLPYDFSNLTNIHNKKYFDILSEIKDYELFFEVYKSIDFKEFDSIDKGKLIDIFNKNTITTIKIQKLLEDIKNIKTTIKAFGLKNQLNYSVYNEEDFALLRKLDSINRENQNKRYELIENLNQREKFMFLNNQIEYIKNIFLKDINKFTNKDFYYKYFYDMVQIYIKNIKISLQDQTDEISIDIINNINNFIQKNNEYYSHNPGLIKDNISNEITEINKNKKIDVQKIFPDPNNRKKEDIISYVNEISPNINDEKLNILKNYKYLYNLQDCLDKVVNLPVERLKKLFSNKSLNYQYVFGDNKDLLRYYIFELDIKNIYFNTLKIIFRINKDSIFDFELKKKILDNPEKFNDIYEDRLVNLLKELIQFPGLTDKFLDLDKDLIKNYIDIFSSTIIYDDLIKIINKEKKDPLDIFMKKYYLLDLLSSSKELLNSFNTKYKNYEEECFEQLSNIGDLLIDFKPNNQELLNALREFLPNLSKDEFNKCELVDQLFDFLSKPNQKLNVDISNAVNPNSPKL